MTCVICLEEKDAPKVCKYCECSIHNECMISWIETSQNIEFCPCCRRSDWLLVPINMHVAVNVAEQIINVNYNSIVKNGMICLIFILSIYAISFSIVDTSVPCYFASVLIPIFLTWLEVYFAPVLVYLNVRNGTPPPDGHACLWLLYACTFCGVSNILDYGVSSVLTPNTCGKQLLVKTLSSLATCIATFPCSISVRYGIETRDYLRCFNS